MSTESLEAPRAGARTRTVRSRAMSGRNRYLVGALCMAIIAVMVAPIVFSILASVKTNPAFAVALLKGLADRLRYMTSHHK